MASLFRSLHPQQPPQQLGGRWDIIRPLAEGGMGALYVGRHHHTGRNAAIKLMNREDPLALSRFKLEATVAAQVDHPGIVQVFDADFDSERNLCFIAMELLEGRTLRAVMEDPKVPPQRILELLMHALLPLAAAHEAGFVHRDLKPENIFVLDPPRDNALIKLLDFGIASQERVDRLTRTGTAMGTPHYMSPEQAVNARMAGPPSDVWSIGVMIYEALRGQVPFVGESVHAVIVQACTKEHEPLEASVPDLDPALARLVDRCLAKEPANRPANAGELFAEMRAMRRPTSLPGVRPRRPESQLAREAASEMRQRLQDDAIIALQARKRGLWIAAAFALVLALGVGGATATSLFAVRPVLTLVLIACSSTLLGALAMRPFRPRTSVRATPMPLERPVVGKAERAPEATQTAERPALTRATLGRDDAPMEFELFLDLTDPATRRLAQRIINLRHEHPDEVKLVFYPLPIPGRDASWTVAEIVRAVLEQQGAGPLWTMLEALVAMDRRITSRIVEELAVSLGLAAHDLSRAMRARTYQRHAVTCREHAVARGVTQSPTIFLNGKLIDGELTEDALRWKLRDLVQAREEEKPAADPGLMPTAPPVAHVPPTVTLRGVLIRYEGARNAPPTLRRTRAQARLRAEKLTARAGMPGADFAELALRFGDQLLDAETTKPTPDDALATAVAQLQVNEVTPPVECDEGFYVALRMA